MNVDVRWRWARNGAIIGLMIVLADLLLEWRGNRFEVWQGEGIMINCTHILTMIAIPAFLGLLFGYFRDRRRLGI